VWKERNSFVLLHVVWLLVMFNTNCSSTDNKTYGTNGPDINTEIFVSGNYKDLSVERVLM